MSLAALKKCEKALCQKGFYAVVFYCILPKGCSPWLLMVHPASLSRGLEMFFLNLMDSSRKRKVLRTTTFVQKHICSKHGTCRTHAGNGLIPGSGSASCSKEWSMGRAAENVRSENDWKDTNRFGQERTMPFLFWPSIWNNMFFKFLPDVLNVQIFSRIQLEVCGILFSTRGYS